jgi:hypothetical protein
MINRGGDSKSSLRKEVLLSRMERFLRTTFEIVEEGQSEFVLDYATMFLPGSGLVGFAGFRR